MPATAQESPGLVFENPNEMSAEARHFNEVETVQTLCQCPGTHCNRGEARPGQALGEICTITIDGIKWALVYNRANGHSGFINTLRLIHPDPDTHCNNVGVGGSINRPTWLYQCPAHFCNRGEANGGNQIRAECFLDNRDGTYWIWMFNLTNPTRGFYYDRTNYDLERC
jgi:hypothetical protein